MREYAALKSHGSDLCQLFIAKYVFFVVTIRINVKIHQKQNVAGPKHLMQIRYKNNALSLFFVVSLTSYLQSQSELYHVSSWYYTLVIDLIGQIRHCVFGRLSVKP